jgi:hypothetical protein
MEEVKFVKEDGTWTNATEDSVFNVVSIDEAISFLETLKCDRKAKYISFPNYTTIVECD